MKKNKVKKKKSKHKVGTVTQRDFEEVFVSDKAGVAKLSLFLGKVKSTWERLKKDNPQLSTSRKVLIGVNQSFPSFGWTIVAFPIGATEYIFVQVENPWEIDDLYPVVQQYADIIHFTPDGAITVEECESHMAKVA